MSTETDLRLAQPDERSEFVASEMEPIRLPDLEDENSCRHSCDCDECGPNEVWAHETAALIRGWADAIFRLANASSSSVGLSDVADANRLEHEIPTLTGLVRFTRAAAIYRRHRRRPNPPNRNTMTKMTTMIAVVDIWLLPSGILGQARSGEPHLALPRLSPTWLDSCSAGSWRDNKLTETSNLPAEERSGPAVLVVEDDHEQRETLCAMLELEGFRHAEAANGRRGSRLPQ
jgi:hypothetical protein